MTSAFEVRVLLREERGVVLIELYGPGSAMAATSSGGGKKALFGLSLGLLAVGLVLLRRV